MTASDWNGVCITVKMGKYRRHGVLSNAVGGVFVALVME